MESKPDNHPSTSEPQNNPNGNGDANVSYSETEEAGEWWDEEDPEKPWMSQSTKLMPNTTIALWQITPYVSLSQEMLQLI